MKKPLLPGLIKWMKIERKCSNYLKRLTVKMKQARGFKGGAFFSCHVRFSLVLIKAQSGAFPSIFLRSHNER